MPLYSVGAGDLDITAQALNDKLTQIFDISTSWGAIVLIDEADVFLEERSVNDLQRNAMVAVFLRQLEYYQGILILTTNMPEQCDAAFESKSPRPPWLELRINHDPGQVVSTSQ